MRARGVIRNVALVAAIFMLIGLIGIAIYNGLNATASWAAFREDATEQQAKEESLAAEELDNTGTVTTSTDTITIEDDVADDPVDPVDDAADAAVDEPVAVDPEPEPEPAPAPVQEEKVQDTSVAQTANGSGATGGTARKSSNTASGAYYSIPSQIKVPRFNESAAQKGDGCAIDLSSASDGYIGVRASSKGKLKVQVSCGQMSYNYPLPNNNTVIYLPTNMGNGRYKVRVMLNTSGSRYVQLLAAEGNVSTSQAAPYSLPNYMSWYTASSACVKKARELARGCKNQGEIARSIYTWLTKNVKYDNGKASWAASAHDYIPSPDSTMSSRSGICFDYATLAAAMFRSLGIPCKIVTGNVTPNNVYHAWNMVLINGEWREVGVYLSHGTWGRIDTTFAAGGVTDFRSYRYSERYNY